MALNTQLQGCADSFRPIRNPKPRHMLQAGAASANVSDLVHSISFLFLATRKNNRVVLFLTARTKLPSRLNCDDYSYFQVVYDMRQREKARF